MNKKIKVAFDLDGVLVDKPPLISKAVIEWLFRGHKSQRLYYRFPTKKVEQLIRKASHFYLLRPPIGENIKFVQKLAQSDQYELYVVSGRYSFLKGETEQWLKKRKVKDCFRQIFINLENMQPHLFKEKILKQIKPDIFVDDDFLLVEYLKRKVKIDKMFCYSHSIKFEKEDIIGSLSALESFL
ncbi:MAG: hypothetical protein ACOX50_01155 [Patescibacteria group bacterium]|jgi:hypothetical protein